jgi:FkbM family methyltransferase
MRHIIDELFEKYDRANSLFPLFTLTRYGFEWIPDDGLVLYPANNYAGFIVVLIRQTLPDIPLIVCDDDESKIGTDCNGLKVAPLNQAAQDLPTALFTICSYSEQAEKIFARIAAKLPASLLNHTIYFRQLGDVLPVGDRATKAFDVFRKTSVLASIRNRPKIKEAYDLYQDHLSQAVFVSVLKRYCFGSDTMIPVSVDSHEYFEDVYIRLDDEVFVDCGGFNGDTLLKYLDIVGPQKFKEYIVFEPDPGNYKLLMQTVDGLPEEVFKKVTTLPYAVGHEENMLQFDALSNAGSVVNPTGTTAVRCVTLDAQLKDKTPTFIKLDIEGYESFALYGAKVTIAVKRPVLAVCVYHHPFDLYELPLMLKRIVPDYHFILRAYEAQYDYICYAIPSERLKIGLAD